MLHFGALTTSEWHLHPINYTRILCKAIVVHSYCLFSQFTRGLKWRQQFRQHVEQSVNIGRGIPDMRCHSDRSAPNGDVDAAFQQRGSQLLQACATQPSRRHPHPQHVCGAELLWRHLEADGSSACVRLLQQRIAVHDVGAPTHGGLHGT